MGTIENIHSNYCLRMYEQLLKSVCFLSARVHDMAVLQINYGM